MKAWVITWEAGSNRKAPSPRVVAVLPSRLDIRRIAEFLSYLYVSLRGSPEERVEYARSARLPFTFQPRITGPMDPHFKVPRSSEVVVGHNPWLRARVVENLRPSGSSFRWNEAPGSARQTRERRRRGAGRPQGSKNKAV